MHLHRSDENRFEVQFSHRTTETAMDNPPNQSFSAHQWTCFIMIDPLVKSPLLASTFCLMHPPTWIRQCRCAVSPSDDTAIISWRQQLKRRWGQGIGYTKQNKKVSQRVPQYHAAQCQQLSPGLGSLWSCRSNHGLLWHGLTFDHGRQWLLSVMHIWKVFFNTGVGISWHA